MSYTWDATFNAFPAGGDALSQGDDRIRDTRSEIYKRMITFFDNWATDPDTPASLDVKDGVILAEHINGLTGTGAVSTDNIPQGSTNKYLNGGTLDDLPDGATYQKVASVSGNLIQTASIATGAVTGAKIATDTITATNIAADAVGASEIAAGAVGNSELASGAVTNAKINKNLPWYYVVLNGSDWVPSAGFYMVIADSDYNSNGFAVLIYDSGSSVWRTSGESIHATLLMTDGVNVKINGTVRLQYRYLA